jgi:MoaA/NifB/PqqE/SkfB family radical SAM enzyme
MSATDRKVYYIDVIEGCNLRCPSCPVGNMRGAPRPKGRMSLELFERILDKIARETPNVQYVGLFSWSEPLLHPEIGRMVAAVKQRGFPCWISANLNRIDHLESVIEAGVDNLRISLSGFYQEVYSQTHEGGDIETVKANMRRLRELMDKHHATTKVLVAYHKYRHNMGRDYDAMCALADELGFLMDPTWAFFMPLDKLLDEVEGRLPEKDQKLLKLLAISPAEQRAIYAGTKPSDCALRADQMSINADGTVALCCAVFDKKNTIAQSFLDVSYEELQGRKYSHATCDKCMSHELHKVVTSANLDAVDRIGWRNVGRPLPWHVELRSVVTRHMRMAVYEARMRLHHNATWHAIKSKLAPRALPPRD